MSGVSRIFISVAEEVCCSLCSEGKHLADGTVPSSAIGIQASIGSAASDGMQYPTWIEDFDGSLL